MLASIAYSFFASLSFAALSGEVVRALLASGSESSSEDSEPATSKLVERALHVSRPTYQHRLMESNLGHLLSLILVVWKTWFGCVTCEGCCTTTPNFLIPWNSTVAY
jgi:hypothetical protein